MFEIGVGLQMQFIALCTDASNVETLYLLQSGKCQELSSVQSYKLSTLINYYSKVVP